MAIAWRLLKLVSLSDESCRSTVINSITCLDNYLLFEVAKLQHSILSLSPNKMTRRLTKSGLMPVVLGHANQIMTNLVVINGEAGPSERDLSTLEIMDPISQILLKVATEGCTVFLEVCPCLPCISSASCVLCNILQRQLALQHLDACEELYLLMESTQSVMEAGEFSSILKVFDEALQKGRQKCVEKGF